MVARRARNRPQQKRSIQPERNRRPGIASSSAGASAIRVEATARSPVSISAMLAGFSVSREQMAADHDCCQRGERPRRRVCRYPLCWPESAGWFPDPTISTTMRSFAASVSGRCPPADADERRRAGAGDRRVPERAAVERIRRDPRPPARPLFSALSFLRISSAFPGKSTEPEMRADVESPFTQRAEEARHARVARSFAQFVRLCRFRGARLARHREPAVAGRRSHVQRRSLAPL